ncbi:MAG: hypothetical protein ACXWBO_13775 [Ilumatobacteraceae bacterium]
MRSAIVPRVLGGLTAMYGAYTLARPQSLVRAAGLQSPEEPESVACDLGDAVGFGLAVPPRTKGKVIAVAIGWGMLCASAFPAAGRTR